MVGTRSRAIRRGTSIDANKSRIRWTRVSGHGRSRKRASRRATPDRAGARPYHIRVVAYLLARMVLIFAAASFSTSSTLA